MRTKWPLHNKVCFTGVGATEFGNFPETDAYGLGVAALNSAIQDAGIEYGDIDGLIVSRIPSYERFAEITGIEPRFSLPIDSAGRFASVSAMIAAQAILAGEANTIALVYGNNGRSMKAKYGGGAGRWAPWGFTSPGATHAMMYQRHMHQYGTSSVDLAHIASAIRHHATLNPAAVRRDPMTIDDHQSSRFIAEPLRLYDYCQINDGAVAWIMTTAERAKDMRRSPVYLSGYARQDRFGNSSSPPTNFWFDELQAVKEKVYDRAELKQQDVDGLMIYDNFTPTVLFSLEGLGFCPQGQGGDFVRDGTLQLGKGRWPTNTSGGHLSESYMQGWALIAEAIRQLRGECEERQIKDCAAIQYICATNISQSMILTR